MLLHPQGGERDAIAAYVSKGDWNTHTHTKYHTIEGKRILSNNVPPSPHPCGATQWIKAQTLGSESLVWLLLPWESAVYVGKADDLSSQFLSVGQGMRWHAAGVLQDRWDEALGSSWGKTGARASKLRQLLRIFSCHSALNNEMFRKILC